ncbi:MAG: OmpA family protein [Candidatus Hydrogenedentota bacterium]|nr:MAG: OmpA family protein [Candidatus Hydrogenedentota bacterium]
MRNSPRHLLPILFLILPHPFLSGAAPAGALTLREATFREVARIEKRRGDAQGAQFLEKLGQKPPALPPDISVSYPDRYRNLVQTYRLARRRLAFGRTRPDAARYDDRLTRAEAFLFLAHYELEQGNRGVLSVIRRALREAEKAFGEEVPEPTRNYRVPSDASASKKRSLSPPKIAVTASPLEPHFGESVEISWTVTNAKTLLLDGTAVPLSGKKTFLAKQRRDFRFEATGPGGKARRLFTVNVLPRKIERYPAASLLAIPPEIIEEECAELRWMVFDADEIFLDGTPVDSFGSRSVCPETTTRYRIVARRGDDRAFAAVTVTVLPRGSNPWRIFFDYDDDRIREDALDTLVQVARYLRIHPERRLTIVGHTDSRGTREYNLALGERRARAVRNYFVHVFGIHPRRFVIRSKGEDDPIAPNTLPDGRDNPAGRRMNRRVEFVR